jgi:hypothetical protein
MEEEVRIVNLTQHAATAEQIAAGVVEPPLKEEVCRLITFEDLPTIEKIRWRAGVVASIAKVSGCEAAMIGGAPFFMAPLERALVAVGVKPLYAFSKRESAEEKQPDGSVKKTQVFRHIGFVTL